MTDRQTHLFREKKKGKKLKKKAETKPRRGKPSVLTKLVDIHLRGLYQNLITASNQHGEEYLIRLQIMPAGSLLHGTPWYLGCVLKGLVFFCP